MFWFVCTTKALPSTLLHNPHVFGDDNRSGGDGVENPGFGAQGPTGVPGVVR